MVDGDEHCSQHQRAGAPELHGQQRCEFSTPRSRSAFATRLLMKMCVTDLESRNAPNGKFPSSTKLRALRCRLLRCMCCCCCHCAVMQCTLRVPRLRLSLLSSRFEATPPLLFLPARPCALPRATQIMCSVYWGGTESWSGMGDQMSRAVEAEHLSRGACAHAPLRDGYEPDTRLLLNMKKPALLLSVALLTAVGATRNLRPCDGNLGGARWNELRPGRRGMEQLREMGKPAHKCDNSVQIALDVVEQGTHSLETELGCAGRQDQVALDDGKHHVAVGFALK